MRFLHKEALTFYSRNSDIKQIIRYIIPLSFAMMCSKFLTYTSYGLIPVSLTHTVKALTPFFNVFLVFLWTGDSVSFPTLLSLIPIVLGVIYASVNEIEYHFFFNGNQKIQWNRFSLCAYFNNYRSLAKHLSKNANENGFRKKLRIFGISILIQRFTYVMVLLVAYFFSLWCWLWKDSLHLSNNFTGRKSL